MLIELRKSLLAWSIGGSGNPEVGREVDARSRPT